MIKKQLILLAFLFLAINLYCQNSYIIGDSQSLYISNYSKHAKLYRSLYKSGIGVKELNDMVINNEVVDDARNVFISIGVNDNYFDLGINKLINNVREKFPNAYVFFIRGSFGWGNVSEISNNSKRYVNYYNKFRSYKIYVLDQDIGIGDPHQDKWQYREIGNYIDYIIYTNWKREQTPAHN